MQNNLQFKDICRVKKTIRIAYNNDMDFEYNNETEEINKNLGYNMFGEDDSGVLLHHWEIVERFLNNRHACIINKTKYFRLRGMTKSDAP